jgi:hypothetical protein
MRLVSAKWDRERARSSGDADWLAICIAFVAMLTVAASSFARADDDLPGRVGRIADFAGQPFLSAQDRPDDWTPVGINYPVSSGDNLWVSHDGRAEVDYGGGQFRLAGDTNVNVARLDDHDLTLFVARGRLIIRVRVLDTDDVVRVDTPNTQIAVTRPGLYRIEVTADGSTTTFGVHEGEGFVALATGAEQALPGESVTVSGTEPLTADVRSGLGSDGFDAWSANRDRYYERARAAPYVSRQMVGFVDLDAYGSWEETPEYGPVWYPTAVATDWAPYDDGYWTNVGAWGLTWVDAAPWGFAPSHYGRWVHNRGRWGWCPGAYVGRPRWAPALVAWYGGAGWGITANGGAPVYGWVPLGWGDAYAPWWRACSQACWNRYNRPFAVDPADRANPRVRYANNGVPGAMTTVPGSTLVGRKPVRGSRVPVPASQLSSAPSLATPPSVTPRSIAAQVFRPGERGTPTPASALYSNARRAASLPQTTPRTAAAEASTSGLARSPGATGSARARPSDVRDRTTPLPAAPAQAGSPAQTAGRAVPATSDAARDAQATRRAGPALPASYAAAREGGVNSGTVVSPATAYPANPASPYPLHATHQASSPVPANGIALPPPGIAAPATGLALPPSGITVPATGLALPPPGITMPPTGIALPPASAMFPLARPVAVPIQNQAPAYAVVPAAAAAGAQQPAQARGNADMDGAHGTRAGAAPSPAPAPAPAAPR